MSFLFFVDTAGLFDIISQMKDAQKIKRTVSLTLLALLLCSFMLLFVSSLISFDFYEPFDMPWLIDAPIAHRGLHGEGVPENSLASFEAAIEQGFHIELDVRLTKDHVPVVFHDTATTRMTGQEHTVSQTPLTFLQGLFLEGTEQNIPTLQQALALIDGRVSVLVEIKASLKENLASIVEVLQNYNGRFALQFFNPWVSGYFANHMPTTPRGMLLGGLGTFGPTPLLRIRDNYFGMIAKPNFVAYQKDYVFAINLNGFRQKGLVVLGYTFNQSTMPEEYAPYLDNVIFDQ